MVDLNLMIFLGCVNGLILFIFFTPSASGVTSSTLDGRTRVDVFLRLEGDEGLNGVFWFIFSHPVRLMSHPVCRMVDPELMIHPLFSWIFSHPVGRMS